MTRNYVTYKIYIKGRKKPIERTLEYMHQSEISKEIGNIRTHGWTEKLGPNEVDWHPVTSIEKVNYKTFSKNE